MSGLEAPIVNNLAGQVLGATQKQGNYLALVKWHVEHVNQAMDRLKARRDDILRLVEAAEARQEIRTSEVKDWILKVSDMETRVARIQERYNSRCLCFGCCGVNCWSNYRIGKAAAKKLPKLEKLLADGAFATLTTRPQPAPAEEEPNTPKVVGMETNLAKALRYIDGDAGIVGIWGMGGVGKTTLLLSVNNSFLPGSTRSSDFDHVIWAVASRDLNVDKLQRDIAAKLKLPLDKDAEMPERAAAIRNFLNKKNFLLLLDDLWVRLDLNKIGIPTPCGGAGGKLKHKVVLTTRSKNVCGKMEAHTRLKVECLEWEESWELFKYKVGDDTINAVAPALAEDVARECRGLPLALIVTGSAMSTKTEPKDWRFAAAKLREAQHAEISGKEGEKMLNLLKFSYDSLPDDTTRSCFLSCSMWPEDHPIDPDSLTECWMGLDLIDEPNEIDATYMKGHSIITRLKEACLLEPGGGSADDREVKMHDVIRDLALWIVSDRGKLDPSKWLVKAGVGLSKPAIVAELWRRAEAAERMSLMHNPIEELPQQLPSLPNLKVLVLQNNDKLSMIPPSFFQSIPAITFLDLSGTKIQELPEDIGSLGSLQYLNLSTTFIRTLPEELASLQKLKHLLLRDTKQLSEIPSGVLSRLRNLQVLDLYSSRYMDWETEDGLALDELSSELLRGLGITVNSISALRKLSTLSVSTRRLCVKRMDSLMSRVIRLRPSAISDGFCNLMHSLQHLMVSGCSTWTELIVERDDHHQDSSTDADWSLQNLEFLDLVNLVELEDIRIHRGVAAALFPALRMLKIVGCYQLSNASWVVQLPYLESLEIHFCPEMRELVGEDVGEKEIRMCFPRLRKLVLHALDVLRSICRRVLPFPLVEIIDVTHCDELKRLPIESGIIGRKLREIRGSEGWWNGLEWEEGDAKATLTPYFRVLEDDD